MDGRPIANKYREGKMKRTLKRELKVLEIVEGKGSEVGGAPGLMSAICRLLVPGAGQHRSSGEGEELDLTLAYAFRPIEEPSGRSLSPSGAAPSGCWRKASDPPVLKHGPRSLTCMRAGGRQTHEAQVT